MNFPFDKLTAVLSLISILLLAGCGKKELIRPGDSLDTAYEKALNQYEKENYREAIDAFETVLQIGRGTAYAENAQYYLAESYFQKKDYLLAASEYERFSSLYPRSERREEVDFKEAFCYYKLSPRYQLEQKYTRRAIEKFRLFQSRYPDSERIKETAKYITDMRSKLAKKLYYAADLYMRLDQFEAATIYYSMTIDRYPETSWAELALVKQINAYVIYANRSVRERQEERYQKAIDSYEKYLQLFPNGKHRSEAENYVDDAREALANLSPVQQTSTASSDTTNQR